MRALFNDKMFCLLGKFGYKPFAFKTLCGKPPVRSVYEFKERFTRARHK